MTVYRGEATQERKLAGSAFGKRQLQRRPANSGITTTGSSLPHATFRSPAGGQSVSSGVSTFLDFALMNNEFDPDAIFSIPGGQDTSIVCDATGTSGAIYLFHCTVQFGTVSNTTGYRLARCEQSGGLRGLGLLPNEVLAAQATLSVTGYPTDNTGGASISVQLAVRHTQGAALTVTILTGGIWRTSFS